MSEGEDFRRAPHRRMLAATATCATPADF